MKKRLLSLAVCLALCLTMVPPAALAEESVAQPTEPTETTAATETVETTAATEVTEATEVAETTESTEAAETTEATLAPETTPATQPETVSRIRLVQDMIDALPETVTAENRQSIIAMLEAIDQAKLALSDRELAQVDFAKYEAIALALGEDHTPSLLEEGEVAVDSEAALRAALDGSASTIIMEASIKLTAELKITRTVDLGLGGHTLTGTISIGEDLVLQNGYLEGTVTIESGKTAAFKDLSVRNAVNVQSGATLMGDRTNYDGAIQLNGGTLARGDGHMNVRAQVTVSGKSTISGGDFYKEIKAGENCALNIGDGAVFYGGIAAGCNATGDIVTLMNGTTRYAQVLRSGLSNVTEPTKGSLYFVDWYTGEGGTGKQYSRLPSGEEGQYTTLYAKFLDPNDVRTEDDLYTLWEATKDVKLGADIYIDTGSRQLTQPITIDLNGHTMTGLINVHNARLTLKNGTFKGTLNILGRTLTLEKMTIEQDSSNANGTSKLRIDSGGTLQGSSSRVEIDVDNQGDIRGDKSFIFTETVNLKDGDAKLSGGLYFGEVNYTSGTIRGASFSMRKINRNGSTGFVKSAIFYGSTKPDSNLYPSDAKVITIKDGNDVYAYGIVSEDAVLPDIKAPSASTGDFLGWYTTENERWDLSVSGSKYTDGLTLTAKFGKSTVTTEDELKEALENQLPTITLGANIALTKDLTIDRVTTLVQGTYKLTSNGGKLILKANLKTDDTDLYCKVTIKTEVKDSVASDIKFRGEVEVDSSGAVYSAVFYKPVVNNGEIGNSHFYDTVTNNGKILQSLFYKEKPTGGTLDPITITFKIDDQIYAWAVVKENDHAPQPADPTAADKVFLDWCTKDDYVFDCGDHGDLVTENMELTATWIGNTATTEEELVILIEHNMDAERQSSSVKLGGDITLSNDILIEFDESMKAFDLTIDLNGHSLSWDTPLTIGGDEADENGSLTLTDSGKGGTISGLNIDTYGTLYANGGTITGDVVNNGTITANGGPTQYTTFTGKVTGSGYFYSGIYMGAVPGDAQTRTTLGPHLDFYWEKGILYAVEIVGTNQVTVAPQTLQAPTGAKPGYKVENWGYTFGNKLTKTTTLSANLTPITYTIQLDEDGDGTAETTKTLKYDEEYILPAPGTTKKDHTFLGWKLGTTTTYPAQKKVKNLTTTAGDTLTLTGVWEKTEVLEVAWSVTVKQSGTAAPGKTAFDLDVLSFDDDLAKDPLFTLTWTSNLTTNGKGTYNGVLTLSGARSNIQKLKKGGGFYVGQRTGTASGWTYDKTVYYVNLIAVGESCALSIYPVKTEMTDDGIPVYTPDKTKPTDISLTNTYTKAANKSDTTNPKTGDTAIYFAQATMLLSLAALILLTKKRPVRS